MFSEIRTSERIREKSKKERELDFLYKKLFDARIGSQRYMEIQNEIDRINNTKTSATFNPDARI